MIDVKKIQALQARSNELGLVVDACHRKASDLIEESSKLQAERKEIHRQIRELLSATANDAQIPADVVSIRGDIHE